MLNTSPGWALGREYLIPSSGSRCRLASLNITQILTKLNETSKNGALSAPRVGTNAAPRRGTLAGRRQEAGTLVACSLGRRDEGVGRQKMRTPISPEHLGFDHGKSNFFCGNLYLLTMVSLVGKPGNPSPVFLSGNCHPRELNLPSSHQLKVPSKCLICHGQKSEVRIFIISEK